SRHTFDSRRWRVVVCSKNAETVGRKINAGTSATRSRSSSYTATGAYDCAAGTWVGDCKNDASGRDDYTRQQATAESRDFQRTQTGQISASRRVEWLRNRRSTN